MVEGNILWNVYVTIVSNFGYISMLLVLLSFIAYRCFDVSIFSRNAYPKEII